MPELPEVEVVRRDLAVLASGARILAVPHAQHPRWGGGASLAGARFGSVDRRGKYLMLEVLELGSGTVPVWLVVHLGMTGQLTALPAADTFSQASGAPGVPHLRLRVVTDQCVLSLADARGFGFARTATEEELQAPPWSTSTFGRLGQDPLASEFNSARAASDLRRRSGIAPVKSLLLDQRSVAGVGNYIADEACWRARVHPASRSLTRMKSRALVDAVVAVVRESTAAGGVSSRDYVHVDGSTGSFGEQLAAYGRAGSPCLRCAGPLVKDRIAGRGTTWCPKCQRLPRS